MPVITALNQKGGVGKTSTCYHLAGTLAQAGRRVLLVDNDPQASLTQGFLGPQVTRRPRPGRDDRGRLPAGSRPRAGHPGHRDRRTSISWSRQPARRRLQRPRPAPGRLAAADGPPRLPGRRPRPIRPGPDRLPAEPAPASWASLVASDAPDRPPPARGLRRPGHRRRPGFHRPGARPARTRT